jgi:hypothetical protein
MKITKDLLREMIAEEIAALREDDFDDMDDVFDKEDKKVKCPANQVEGKAMAIKGIKESRGKDTFKEMEILAAICIKSVKTGKSKKTGEKMHRVQFDTSPPVIVDVRESEIK